MVRRMIDEVPKHLAERVDVFSAGRWLDETRVIEPILGQTSNKRRPLPLDAFPALAHLVQRVQIGPLRHQWIRQLLPPVQPQLLGPYDVTERAVDTAVAALQVPEVRLVGEPRDRVEDRAVRPRGVVEQLQEILP